MTVSVQGTGGQTVVFQTRKITGDDLETNAALLDLDDIPMPTGVVDSNNATYTNFTALYADLPFNQNLKGPVGPQGPAIDTVSLSQSVDLSTVTMSFTYQKDGQTYSISTTPTFTIPAGPVGPQGVQGNPGTNGTNGVDGNDGVGITAVNQPTSTTINFSLSDGTTTSDVTLPGGGGGSGTVTSVAVSGANGITVTGSPVTASGTIALSVNATTLKNHLAITYADIGSTPTTIAGYGITDAFDGAFNSLSGKPTTIAGYGITDAFSGVFSDLTSRPTTISGYGITDAFDGVFASLTSKPTTLNGYGITDALSEFTFSVTAGSGVYAFTGLGTGGNNPTLYLVRGKTYTFSINASGHPFYINTTNTTGTSNQYTSGITGQGSTSGDLVFTVPQDAPKTLYYNCQYHSSMNGTIHILDHTFDFADLGSKPTTIAGYGITDAFDGAFASLTSKPTTISGYGITDAFSGVFADLTSKPTTIAGYGITDAFDGAFGSLTSTPTTVAGYGITDALTSVDLTTNVGATVLPYANGGTGLSTLGSAGQVLRVNGTGNGLEYGTVSGSGGGITEDQAIAYAIALG